MLHRDDIAILAIGFALLLVVTGVYAWSFSWAVRDARSRGRAGLAIPLVLLFGPMGALVWLAVRPMQKLADKPFDDYGTAEDAFHAASQLDSTGDWDAAIALYRYGTEHWPEHREYAEKCIDQIRRKADMTRGA